MSLATPASPTGTNGPGSAAGGASGGMGEEVVGSATADSRRRCHPAAGALASLVRPTKRLAPLGLVKGSSRI